MNFQLGCFVLQNTLYSIYLFVNYFLSLSYSDKYKTSSKTKLLIIYSFTTKKRVI